MEKQLELFPDKEREQGFYGVSQVELDLREKSLSFGSALVVQTMPTLTEAVIAEVEKRIGKDEDSARLQLALLEENPTRISDLRDELVPGNTVILPLPDSIAIRLTQLEKEVEDLKEVVRDWKDLVVDIVEELDK